MLVARNPVASVVLPRLDAERRLDAAIFFPLRAAVKTRLPIKRLVIAIRSRAVVLGRAVVLILLALLRDAVLPQAAIGAGVALRDAVVRVVAIIIDAITRSTCACALPHAAGLADGQAVVAAG